MNDLNERIEPPNAYRIADGPPAPGATVIVLEGEFDVAAAPALRARLDAVPAGEAVVLDVAAVTFVDSAILRELLRGWRALDRFVLAGPPPQLERLLELTRTAELFELAPDPAAALTRLTG